MTHRSVGRALASLVILVSACGAPPAHNESNLEEDVGTILSELRKGMPGAAVGQSNYCADPLQPCTAGEGDCDSSADCAAGLVCARKKLIQYGFPAGDACVPAHCANKRKDADETQIDCGGECGTTCAPPVCAPNGGSKRCNADCLCSVGEGDCDSSADCVPGLVCARHKLTQYGFTAGDACVPAHCTNKRKDTDETQIDCGGECGSVNCPHLGCLNDGTSYVISVQRSYRELWPISFDDWGVCESRSGTNQSTLYATVSNGAIVVQGPGFAGIYPVIEETSTGFTAQAGSLFGSSYSCGDAFDRDDYGLVTMTFACATATVAFTAQCTSDISADGCYPNFEEHGRGTGTRIDCSPGYSAPFGSCEDIDECAALPCKASETCTNLPGSYRCSCDAPAIPCDGRCVNIATDRANCGGCAVVCPTNESCSNGRCAGWAALDAGWSSTCGLRSDGSVVCWGAVSFESGATDTFVAVSTGMAHACALRSDGTVRCWGDDFYGQATPPPDVFTSISSGFYYTCGLRFDGTVKCWGSATEWPTTETLRALAAGAYHACGLRADGTVFCWGADFYGQASPPAGGFLALDAGTYYTCGVREDSTVACWGNDWHQQSSGVTDGPLTMVATGEGHTCAIRTDGTISCWGNDFDGGATPPAGQFTSITAGLAHTCGLRSDGNVQCWGCRYNDYGQCIVPN